MTATADFNWTYDLIVNREVEADRFNIAMALLEGFLNSLKARVDLLDGAALPPQYATKTNLSDHVQASSPHVGMLKFRLSTPLAGSSAPPTTAVTVQTIAGVVGGSGYVDLTFVERYQNALLSAVPVATATTPQALSIASPTLGTCRVYGAATTPVRLTLIGW